MTFSVMRISHSQAGIGVVLLASGVVPWMALLATSRADVLLLLQRGQPALTLV